MSDTFLPQKNFSEEIFFEKLQDYAQTAKDIVEYCQSEEQTKLSLINPYLEIIGFDVRNPKLVSVEFTTGTAKRHEKVDYAILDGKEAVIFIEAKSANTGLFSDLSKNTDQLRRYMLEHYVPFGILTNGIIYQWYGRDAKQNVEEEPFLKHDVTSPSNIELSWLFNIADKLSSKASAQKFAEDHIIQNKLLSWIKEVGSNPSDNFLKFALNDLGYETTYSKGRELVGRTHSLWVEMWSRHFVDQQFTSSVTTENEEEVEEENTAGQEREFELSSPTPSTPTPLKPTRSQKCWIKFPGQEKEEVSNASILMLRVLEWASSQHSEGSIDYLDRVSRALNPVRNNMSIVMHQRDYDEDNPVHKRNYSTKFTENGWTIFNNVSNPGKLTLIDNILNLCIRHDRLSPRRGIDLQIFMPSVPELAIDQN